MSQPERHSPNLPTDPSGIDQPHDILAAEEFGIGTRDDRFPADPSGIQEPHDILAAEEFAMPAPGSASESPSVASRATDPRAVVPVVFLLAAIVVLVLRRRS
jgi:hypothetical protein